MGFSYDKAMAIKPSKEKWLSTFLIALLVAGAMFIPFMVIDKGYFIFYGDFNVQQIPFYQMCHNMVRQGDFGWSWLTDLGSDMVGSYAYYLISSPFFWLTLPFPNSFVPYLMGPLLILKFACAALTAYLYIRRFTKTPEAARLGGILYAFCGFSVYNIFFNSFHEAIIVFPLLLLSFELILTEKKHGLFAFCVFLSAGINYFFFFGMVVFTVIYFIIRLCSKTVKISFGHFMLMLFEAVLGLALSAIIVLPGVMFVLGNNRLESVQLGWGAIMYGKEQIYLNVIECFFFPPDIPARPVFFPGANVKWSSLGGWLPLFSMVGVFAYCGAKKGNWIKRVICTSFVFAMFPILNSTFTAFNTSYYARWFFMPILIMCLATVMAIEDREVEWSSAFKWVGFITAAFSLVIGLFPSKDSDGKIIFGLFTDSQSSTYITRFWATCAIAAVSFIILLVIFKTFKKRDKLFINVAVIFVCIISVIYGTVFIYTGKQHSYDPQTIVIPSLIEGEVILPDSDNYRIDTYDCADNTGMSLGLPTINAFHSTVSPSITEFYEVVGEDRVVASRPDVKNYAIRNLLSVKYVLNLENEDEFMDEFGETAMPGYTYYSTQSGYKIYENQNYVPYGFSYDKYISRTALESYSEKTRANIMLKALVLNDEDVEKYKGDLEPLDVSVPFNFSEEELANDCKALADTSATLFSHDKNGFKATVTREKESLVFFSVPFDKGWTATVNGKEAEIINANIGFMAVNVGEGVSNIEFTFTTPYLALGIQISIAALCVFCIYMIISLITRKNRRPVEYMEGDTLIEKWLSYDIADALEETEEEEELTSIDRIAEELSHKYPISKEFTGGFTVNVTNNPKNS